MHGAGWIAILSAQDARFKSKIKCAQEKPDEINAGIH